MNYNSWSGKNFVTPGIQCMHAMCSSMRKHACLYPHMIITTTYMIYVIYVNTHHSKKHTPDIFDEHNIWLDVTDEGVCLCFLIRQLEIDCGRHSLVYLLLLLFYNRYCIRLHMVEVYWFEPQILPLATSGWQSNGHWDIKNWLVIIKK